MGQHSGGFRHSTGCGDLHGTRDSQCHEHFTATQQGQTTVLVVLPDTPTFETQLCKEVQVHLLVISLLHLVTGAIFSMQEPVRFTEKPCINHVQGDRV